MMSYNFVALILLSGGAVLHIFAAGRGAHRAMQTTLSGRLQALESVTWHAVSVWLLLHLGLAGATFFSSHPLLAGALVFASFHALVLGIMCLGVSLVQCRSWVAMPQAYLFMMIAVSLGMVAWRQWTESITV